MALPAELTLEQLQEALAQWRQTRRPRQIPAALGANAVALLGRHRTNELLRALRIDHRTLRRWQRQYGDEAQGASRASTPAFVALPVATAPAAAEETEATLKVTRQARDGTALSLEGTLTLRHWRAALTLLAAEEAVG